MAPPKDIARSYPKRGLTGDVGFRSEPKFCGDGSTEFDGSADELSTTATLSVATVPIQTFCVWVKPTTDNANRGIVVNGLSNSNDAFYLYQYLTGYGQASNTSSPGQSRNFALNSVKKDQWQFLCGVYDATDPASVSFSLYVDGVSYSDTAPLGTGAVSGFFKVGRSSSGYFAGKIANVKVFDVALTQDQVRELYNNPGLIVPTGVSSSNLKRYYKLETNFNDSGADSENLTSVGSPSFTVDRPQLPRGLDLARGAAMARVYTGRCVDFDGSTDFLDMGTGLDKNYTTRSDRASFSCWFNTDQISAAAWIYQNRTQLGGTSRSECETQLFTHPSLGLVFDGDFASILIPTTDFNIGQWHHFVGIADDSDGPVKAYLDGVLYDTTSIPQSGANGSEFLIGGRNNSPLQIFNGQISNFKIFNVELTQAQVRELYHNPETVIPTGVSASNLRRHYPLCAYNDTGGMGGRYEIDQGVEGVNGEYGGSPVMDFAQPVPCPQLGLQQSATRLYFPANVANYADFTLGSALGSSFTYATWVQPVNNNAQGLYCLFTSGASDQFSAYILSAGTIQAGNTSDVTTTETVTLGDWTHIVITGDSLSPHAKIYINGSAATLSGTIDSAGMTEAGIRLGMRGASSTANRQAHCIFAESAFWDVNLSPSEVSTLYNSGVMGFDTSSVQSSQLKAWHKYDDLTTLKDYSGEGRNATVSGTFNAASFPENASGSTIVGDFSMKRKGVSVLNPALTGSTSLGGSTVACQFPNDGTFDLDASKGFSFSGFLRNERIASTSNLFSTTNYNTASKRFTLGNLGGVLQFRFPDSSGTARTINFSPFTPVEGWHQYAVTMDFASNTVKLFIDGALNVTNTSYTLGTITGVGDIIIGSSRPGGPFAEAAVAAPKFFDVTLSDNEIKQIYNSDLRLIKGLENE